MLSIKGRRLELFTVGILESSGDRETDIETDDVAEAKRPDGVPVTEFHRSVDVGWGGDSFFDHPDRFDAEQDAEPESSRQNQGNPEPRPTPCLDRKRSCGRYRGLRSPVLSPTISSTRAIAGTGLKKCIPMKLSGLEIPSASESIEIALVLDARSRGSSSSASARTRRLRSRASGTASITAVGAGEGRSKAGTWVSRPLAALQTVVFCVLRFHENQREPGRKVQAGLGVGLDHLDSIPGHEQHGGDTNPHRRATDDGNATPGRLCSRCVGHRVAYGVDVAGRQRARWDSTSSSKLRMDFSEPSTTLPSSGRLRPLRYCGIQSTPP